MFSTLRFTPLSFSENVWNSVFESVLAFSHQSVKHCSNESVFDSANLFSQTEIHSSSVERIRNWISEPFSHGKDSVNQYCIWVSDSFYSFWSEFCTHSVNQWLSQWNRHIKHIIKQQQLFNNHFKWWSNCAINLWMNLNQFVWLNSNDSSSWKDRLKTFLGPEKHTQLCFFLQSKFPFLLWPRHQSECVLKRSYSLLV